MAMMLISTIGGSTRPPQTLGGSWRISRVRTRWEPLPTPTARISIVYMASVGASVPICCATTSLPIHGRPSTAGGTLNMPLWQGQEQPATGGTFSVPATIHIVSTNGMKLIFRANGQNESLCQASGRMPFVQQVPTISIWQTGNILAGHSPMANALMISCVTTRRRTRGLLQGTPPKRQSTVSVSLSTV